jgi:hypothetical protein
MPGRLSTTQLHPQPRALGVKVFDPDKGEEESWISNVHQTREAPCYIVLNNNVYQSWFLLNKTTKTWFPENLKEKVRRRLNFPVTHGIMKPLR